jgi:outer membrane protein OmpA-like peptidoglycan-associated protein
MRAIVARAAMPLQGAPAANLRPRARNRHHGPVSLDAPKKRTTGLRVAPIAAAFATLAAGCADNRLPPNPVPHADLRRPVPLWFDPNAAFDAKSGETRVYIEGKIVFQVDKAILKPESEKVLSQLLAFLQARGDVTRLRIEGHTDSTASDEHNQELSARRALAVADWLVDRGIDHVRLVAVGFGESKPRGPNDVAAGRAENRRTEFHVMEVNGRPFGSVASLNGGMVLTVMSAEERMRAANPPKLVFKEIPPFTPTGNEIKEFAPKPKNTQDPALTMGSLQEGVGGAKGPDAKAPGEAGAAPAGDGDKPGSNAPKPVVP